MAPDTGQWPRFLLLPPEKQALLVFCSETCVRRTGYWKRQTIWVPERGNWCLYCFGCGRQLHDPVAAMGRCRLHGTTGCPDIAPMELTHMGCLFLDAFRRVNGRVPTDMEWDRAAEQSLDSRRARASAPPGQVG